MSDGSDSTGSRPETAATQTFVLTPGAPPYGFPMMIGFMSGLFVIAFLGRSASPLGSLGTPLAGLAVAVGVALLFMARLRSQIPDRLHVTPTMLELARGPQSLRRVHFAKLSEVTELQTAVGPVLLVADDRHALAVAATQLKDARQYETITRGVVEAVQVADPSGELGRQAVSAGRLRARISQQPVRGTLVLAVIIGLCSLLATGARATLLGVPYPDLQLGAFTPALFWPREAFRIVSYAFVHADMTHLITVLAGLVWLGAYVEKLVGWERVVLAFFAGVAGAAVGHALVPWAMPALGASGGVFGLFGLVVALVLIGGRQLPRALHPPTVFWGISAIVLWLLVLPSLAGSLELSPLAAALATGGLPVSAAQTIAWTGHLGGLVAGFLVSAVFLVGVDLPATERARRSVRAFAGLAGIALILGIVGMVTHARREHGDDDELMTQALLALPPGEETAVSLNEFSYRMLISPTAGPEAFEHAERLAVVAVSSSGRQRPEILDTLAVAHYRLGNQDDAREVLEEALKLPLENPGLRKLIERRLRDVNAGGALTPDDQP